MQLTQQEMIVLRKTFLFHRLTPAAYMKLSEGRFTGAFRQELRTGQMLEWPQGQEHCLGVVIAGELTELRAPAFPNRSLREGSVMGGDGAVQQSKAHVSARAGGDPEPGALLFRPADPEPL